MDKELQQNYLKTIHSKVLRERLVDLLQKEFHAVNVKVSSKGGLITFDVTDVLERKLEELQQPEGSGTSS